MHRLPRPLPLLCCAVSVLSLSGCGGGSSSSLGLTDSATALTRAEKPSPSPSASPSLKPSPKPSPSPSPTAQPLQGAVSALIAGKSFTLTPPPPPGQTTAPPPLTVDLSSTTKILGPDGKVVTLANGQDVCVRGKLNTETKTVAADEVQVIPPPPLQGAVSALKAGVSFTLTPPPGDNDAPALTVLLLASTKITGPDGKTAALASSEAVTVTGALDKVKKTVTADVIAILAPPPPVQGVIKAVDVKILSFTLTPPPPPPGANDAPPTLTVETDSKTKIVKKGVNGSADAAATFADLKVAECVAVVGSIAKGSTTDDASEVDILPPPPSK